MDYQALFARIALEVEAYGDHGSVASYIPELSRVDPNKFGMHLTTVTGEHYGYGDAEERFSIQSISKVLSLALAFRLEGDGLWERVDVEPSGSPFNSLVQLEYEHGIPRNPFINAGAIVVCDILLSRLSDPKADLLQFIREVSGHPTLQYSEHIAQSEMETGHRNAALTYLMKDFGNIHNPVEAVLDLYFHLCSIEMTCAELSRAFLFLAMGGKNPDTGAAILSNSMAKRINACMQLCGFYDEAGEFAFCVGLPGKSGVGGGIVAVHPEQYSIAVWSPRLNPKGNSYQGMKALELFTTYTGSSIF